MKKGIIWILLGALVLSGCSGTEPSASISDQQGEGDGTQEGLYVEDSLQEQSTQGAVRIYRLKETGYEAAAPFAGNLLLQKGGAQTELVLLTGGNLTAAVKAELTSRLPQDMSKLQLSSQEIAYMDDQDKALVFLNDALREVSRLQLPETVMGDAWLSGDWSTVYYCTEQGVHAMDRSTGISRVLVQNQGVQQCLTGVLFAGYVIRWETQTESGGKQVHLLDAQTGETLWSAEQLENLKTAGSLWYLEKQSGSVLERLVGQGEAVSNFWPEDTEAPCFLLLQHKRVVAVSQGETEVGLTCYDLQSGEKIATVKIPGIWNVKSICQDGRGIWVLGEERETGAQVICQWQWEKNRVEEDGSYLAPHYTKENPDLVGLQEIDARLTDLEQLYGVEIFFGEIPQEAVPEQYLPESEYLTQAYERYIGLLEAALAKFPEGFFKKLADKTATGFIRIGLVRRIAGTEGKTVDQTGVQYWNGRNAYIMLTLDEQLEQSFYHAVAHLIETKVLSTSTVYYDWDQLNPEGFSYDNDYIKNLEREDTQYLQGEDRYFIDTFSMSFAREDRARVMEYACMPGNEAYFSSPAMQKKLSTFCQGIRKVFSLGNEESFVWEQYLLAESE